MAISTTRAKQIRKNFRKNYGPKPAVTTANVKGRRRAVKAGQTTYMKKDGTTGQLTRAQKLRTMRNLNKKARASRKAPGIITPPTGLPSNGSGATKTNPGKAAPLPQKPPSVDKGIKIVKGKNQIVKKVGSQKNNPPKLLRGGGMAKMASKKMRGGGVAAKKMRGGGMAKMASKKKMMRGGAVKKK